jgi:preprotein translocase subunit SecY
MRQKRKLKSYKNSFHSEKQNKMKTLSKILLIFLALMIGGIIIVGLNEAQGTKSGGGGPIGVILSIGIFAAIRAIWKWKPESEKKKDMSTNNQQLDKRP